MTLAETHQATRRLWRRRCEAVNRVLVTGALGQMGSWLVPALRAEYGAEAVLATDLRPATDEAAQDGPFLPVDAANPGAVTDAVRRHRPSVVYHLAAVLSAVAERDPARAWQVNLGSLRSVLEACAASGCALFVAELDRGLRPGFPVRSGASGREDATDKHLWHHQADWRAALRLPPPPLQLGCAWPALPGARIARGSARRRHHRLGGWRCSTTL